MSLGRGRALAAVAVATAVGALPAAADTPTPTPGPTGPPGPPVTVRLVSLRPLAPQPGDTLVLRGTLTNSSAAPVSGLAMQLLLSNDQVGSRDVFDHYANDTTGAFSVPSFVVNPVNVALPADSLAPAASEPFTVSARIDDLGLPRAWQVRALGLDVTGLTTAGTQTVGRLHTFLPWAPLGVPGVGLPTRVAWMWPLVDRPHRTAAPAWADDTLAGELTGTGRLATLVAAGAAAATQHTVAARPPRRIRRPRRPTRPTPAVTPVPLTWVVDPMLLEDARTMSNGYRVRGRSGPRPGVGAAAARAWLAALESATSHGDVLALPYADPDVVAAVHGGLTDLVQVATTAGTLLVTHDLGRTPLTFGWPPDGQLDQRTLDTLFASGVTTVVLSDAALPVVGGPPNETPSAHTTIAARDGNVDALLVDSTLAGAIQDGVDHPGDDALDVQRVMSELLMIQAELPSDQRTIVLAPDRRWAPTAAYASALASATGRVPWVAPVSLADAAASPVYDKVRREPLAPPPHGSLLPSDYVRTVRALKARIDTFAAVLPSGSALARSFDDALLRTLSSGWRSDVALGTQQRAAVRSELDGQMHRVYIASKPRSLVTLTSHSGVVPITVGNDLDTPVRVVVKINAGQHLRIPGAGRVAKTIPAHRRVPFDLHAAARTSGVFPLTVQLFTPNPPGAAYDEPIQLFVRSTAYGSVALLITGGATVVLLVAVGVRLTRRWLGARAAARGTA